MKTAPFIALAFLATAALAQVAPPTPMQSLFANAPQELLPAKKNAQLTDMQDDALNKWAIANASAPVELKGVVRTALAMQSGEIDVEFDMAPQSLLNSSGVDVSVSAIFPKEQAAKFMKMKNGDKITVAGTATVQYVCIQFRKNVNVVISSPILK